MSEIDDDLHATAESIMHDTAAIQAIEEEKSDLPADDAKVIDLSAESARLAGQVVAKTNVQTSLAEEARRK